jgi:hypothetical protein
MGGGGVRLHALGAADPVGHGIGAIVVRQLTIYNLDKSRSTSTSKTGPCTLCRCWVGHAGARLWDPHPRGWRRCRPLLSWATFSGSPGRTSGRSRADRSPGIRKRVRVSDAAKVNRLVKLFGSAVLIYAAYCMPLFLHAAAGALPRHMIPTPAPPTAGHAHRALVVGNFLKGRGVVSAVGWGDPAQPAPTVIFGHGNGELITTGR